jgi:GH24 family phage-related lysozyme (muramidase)
MNAPNAPTTSDPTSLERERWEVERAFRERELVVKERECYLKEAELDIRKTEYAASRWKSPLIVAIFAAAVAAAGNAVVSYINANSQTTLEAQKSEQARILEMIKTGNPDKAAENLRFLLEAGLIVDPIVRKALTKFLDNRKPGSGPALPSASIPKDVTELLSTFEGAALQPYRDPFGVMIIGTGHALTQEEIRTGNLVIDGKPVDFGAGITSEQAKQLLELDLKPVREEIEKLVTVKLTNNQRDALASLAFHIGMHTFKNSTLLKKLNSGKYDEIPEEMMRWTKAAGRTIPGLVSRREAEVALWRKP